MTVRKAVQGQGRFCWGNARAEQAGAEPPAHVISLARIIQSIFLVHENTALMGKAGRRQSWGQVRNKNQNTWLQKWSKTSPNN